MKVIILNGLGKGRSAVINFKREDEKKVKKMLKKGGFEVDARHYGY